MDATDPDSAAGKEAEAAPARDSPRDRRSSANIISRLFFVWVESLFWAGCRRDLHEPDLSVCPDEARAETLHSKFERHWQHELDRHKNGKCPRLIIAFIKTTWWRFIVQGIIVSLEVALLNCNPIVLGYLSEYFAELRNFETAAINNTECSPLPQTLTTTDAYLLGMGMFLVALLILFLHAHGFLFGQKIGMIVRVIATTAIHKKVLSLSPSTISRVSAGHVINLSSNDVHRFDLAFIFIHFLWIAPLQIAAFSYLIYQEFGWSVFVGLAFVIIFLVTQVFGAKLYASYRFKAARITDKRVRIMNEVIVGIRVIKMYAWEYAFKHVVEAIRKSEVLTVFKGGINRALSLAFVFGVAKILVLFLIVLPFVLSGGTLTPKRVVTTLTLVQVIRITLIVFLVRCFFNIYEAYVAINRIQEFLLLEELPAKSVTSEHNPVSNGVEGKPVSSDQGVVVRELCASWSEEREILSKISFTLDKTNPLLAVVGPVGAGKSTLLQCLLEELPRSSGSLSVNGRLSYTSQEPWIFSGTIRENILFGSQYEHDRYNKVIKACTLDKDIRLFLDGDLTIVGERGVTLSGGQKARVSLARAVYHQADIYLLDDPLSAVDTAVGKHLFDNCIRGLLRDKLVILVTHQVQFALEADKLLALKEGQVEMYGTHSQLEAQGLNTSVLLGLINKEELSSEYETPVDNSEPAQLPPTLIVHEDVVDDEDEPGTALITPLSPNNKLLSPPSSSLGRKQSLEELYDNIEESPFEESIYRTASMISIHSMVDTATTKHEEITEANGPPSEERAHGTVGFHTYYTYVRAGGNFLFLAVLFVILFVAEGGILLSDWWLTDWANCDIQNIQNTNITEQCSIDTNSSVSISTLCSISSHDRLWLLAVINATAIILYMLRAGLIYFLALNASRVLHNRMFASVLRAPVRFFDTNPSGRVLNRFSKDIGFLDDLVPQILLEVLQLFIRFFAILITAVIANVWLIFVVIGVVIVFVLFRNYYLRTARDVKRLEAISRSPIYSHISTTLQGLPIIRTFGKQGIAQRLLHHHQDVHSEGWYMYLVTTRWFGMRIDLLSATFLGVVVFSMIPLASQLNPELVGLSLVSVVSLSGMFQYCIRQSAELENLMISAERVIGYSKLQPEAPLETLLPGDKPPPDWPSQGQITFQDVAFQYASELPLVLKNLDFMIAPGEKVGVVGRTGAGKSSLLSVLYRLAEPSGHISIDNVDIKNIGLHDLRSKMSIIPQEPVLFSGTMRYNIDPFDEFSDAELWDVLEQVQLKGAVEALQGQLGAQVSEGGSNFSVGQKQLVCLARALLRNNRILILDEATANVDPRTDEIIQAAIREKFVEYTVVTIAHRLNTIMDSDRILVMSNGRVEEFDQPLVLLDRADSLLSKMVSKTGPVASLKLRQMAVDAANKRKTVSRETTV